MPTALTIGPVHTLTEDVTYAVAGQKEVFGVTNLAGLEGSVDESTWVALTIAADNTFRSAYPFLRSPSGAAIIRLTTVG